MNTNAVTSGAKRRRVFVSGCFDLLHSGHVEFFQRAAEFGELHVAVGSDRTVFELKGRTPVNSEHERCFMVGNVACVHRAFVSRGRGLMDFEQELREMRPEVFVVNEDGNAPAKRRLCDELGIDYVVLKRLPREGLDARSTTALRAAPAMPYRIDLAGGWLDQPFVSRHHPGSVITVSLEPLIEFNERSGMATSTRRTALRLWGTRLPVGAPAQLAWTLFCCDNPPGKQFISGSQDSIGIVFPGLARAGYNGDYWPATIDHELDEELLRFVESHLFLLPLGPRGDDFDVLSDTRIGADGARALAGAAEACWRAIHARDVDAFGAAVTDSFNAQVAMFPHMVTPTMRDLIEQHRDAAAGWKVSGAGGGGYLILVAGAPVPDSIRIVIRRALE